MEGGFQPNYGSGRVAGFIRTPSILVEPMGHSASVTRCGRQGTATPYDLLPFNRSRLIKRDE
jgi:hypothetical protein